MLFRCIVFRNLYESSSVSSLKLHIHFCVSREETNFKMEIKFQVFFNTLLVRDFLQQDICSFQQRYVWFQTWLSMCYTSRLLAICIKFLVWLIIISKCSRQLTVFEGSFACISSDLSGPRIVKGSPFTDFRPIVSRVFLENILAGHNTPLRQLLEPLMT